MVPAEATMPPFMALIFTPVEVELEVPMATEAAAVELTAAEAAQWVETVCNRHVHFYRKKNLFPPILGVNE